MVCQFAGRRENGKEDEGGGGGDDEEEEEEKDDEEGNTPLIFQSLIFAYMRCQQNNALLQSHTNTHTHRWQFRGLLSLHLGGEARNVLVNQVGESVCVNRGQAFHSADVHGRVVEQHRRKGQEHVCSGDANAGGIRVCNLDFTQTTTMTSSEK